MKKVIVIGGGLAGLSAAFHLSENFEVVLFESSPELGGRCKSFFDTKFNCYLDNGKHLLIKGYKNTLDLIFKSNAQDNFHFQDFFSTTFRDKKRREWGLSFSNSLKMMMDFLSFKNLTFSERLSLLKVFKELKSTFHKKINKLSALDFLIKLNQSKVLIKNFWTLLIESALNTPIEKASAEMFLFVMKKMFIEDKANSGLIIPKKSLHESLIYPLEKYLIKKGIVFYKSRAIDKILFESNRVKEIIDKYGNSHTSNYYIVAVQPEIIKKLIPELNFKLNYQTIINIHLKTSIKNFNDRIFSLWDSFLHWIFFYKDHITIVKSAADKLAQLENSKILELFINELILFFPEITDELIKIKDQRSEFKVIKERRATFLSDDESLNNRPSTKTKFENLFLAGDYINTGYPSTIESAVLSGKLAALEILNLS